MVEHGLELIGVLRTSHLFKRLNDQQIEALADELAVESLAEGSEVFHQGRESKGFYFLLSGRVRAVRQIGHHEQEFAIYDEGDYFGQEGIVAHGIHAVTAQCATNVMVAVITHDRYRALVRRFP